MDQNLVDAELTTTDSTEIDTAIEKLKTKLSFLISLSTRENFSFKTWRQWQVGGQLFLKFLPTVQFVFSLGWYYF